MKHYLIFDSDCPICCNLAQAIEEGASGKLKAISIYGPEARELLQTVYPNGWGHQPYLLTVENSSVKAAAGIAMALRLGLLLGPQKALQIWKLAQKYGVNITSRGVELSRERRGFLKQIGLLFAGLLFLPRDLLDSITRRSAQAGGQPPPPGGELYAGFILLPDGAPVPSIVQPAKLGIPVICGVGGAAPAPSGFTISRNTITDLLREGGVPLYSLREVPGRLRVSGGYVLKHKSGETFAAVLNYEFYSVQTGTWEGSAWVAAYPDFPRPSPLWSSEPVEPLGPATVLEKAQFLPTPGIMVATEGGYVFNWIDRDILYSCVLESKISNGEAQALAESLQLVSQ